MEVDEMNPEALSTMFSLIGRSAVNTYGFDEIVQMITSGIHQQIQAGRHYVAINLFEAESLRAELHSHQGPEAQWFGPRAAIGCKPC
jgi:hypothetical protein